MVLKNQPQRRLGPYWDITGRRRRRFKTNAAWARTEALRADGEGDSKPTPLGPVRGHYGQTEKENQGHAPLVSTYRFPLLSPRKFSPLVSLYRFPLSSLRTVFPSRLSVPFSPLVSPYRFPLSSPRTFSVRGKVALVLWF